MRENSADLSFSVSGEFVTRIAREWFWDESHNWAKVEELLLSCMQGTQQTPSELKNHAIKVVLGQAQFIGNTADGSYALVEDNSDVAIRKVSQIKEQLQRAEEELAELRQWRSDILDKVEAEELEWILEPPFDPLIDASPILKSFIEAHPFDDNYGWLDPGGTFYPVEFGCHEGWARKKIKECGWTEHMCEATGKKHASVFDWGRYLVESRGWVLIHNPSMGIGMPTRLEVKRLTKPQREFLFDYYTKRGKDNLALEYLED